MWVRPVYIAAMINQLLFEQRFNIFIKFVSDYLRFAGTIHIIYYLIFFIESFTNISVKFSLANNFL